MIDRTVLTADLSRLVTALEDDLRARAGEVAEVASVVEREWRAASEAGRTAHDLATWRESLFTQVAVGWVLATTFVRFCEDNGLLPEPAISGPGERRRRAEDAQTVWFREHPADGERAYVEAVLRRAAELPGLGHVLEGHNPVWLFGPSDDAVRDLLAFWREIDPETGHLRHDFRDPTWNTRFLGDLYQDLSASARQQYALLQTPEFVEEFILDRTLEPAVDEFGLDGFRMIDPACGSGHFLLGSFDRLLARWRRRAPEEGDRALAARALASVHGVDLNPFAAAIARFRLLVAALRAAEVRTLAEAPNFPINIAVGDSLLHGPPPGQGTFVDIEHGADPATRHLYATEDRQVIHRMLEGGYHAVVANPPYITPKDPAANRAYRNRYATCHRQYSLAVPFMERLFDLAVRGVDGQPAGFVGQITANSFMKREFGKKLIENFLAKHVDLSHVIDTSGAYIPGHGTPTVILFGRNRHPLGDTLRAVLGIRGEPSRPDDPAKGEVWTSITGLVDQPRAENDYISITDLERDRLARHPWTLQGGGAADLKPRIERAGQRRLVMAIDDLGATLVTRLDDAFEVLPQGRLAGMLLAPYVRGEHVRDWSLTGASRLLFPYVGEQLEARSDDDSLRALWPNRTRLRERIAYGETQTERGLAWFEYSMLFRERLQGPSLVWADIATQNQFAFLRSTPPSDRHAPVIKLPSGASEDDHLALLGLLNSSTACFWMMQVFHNKGEGGGARVDAGYAAMGTEAWKNTFEFDGTKLKQFPIPAGSAFEWAARLDALARELSDTLPAAVVGRGTPSRTGLDAVRARVDEIRVEMVAVQEELDWRCLHLYGITDDDLSLPPDAAPPLAKGERAFEIVLARRMAAGEVTSSWFERHGSTPITEPPAHWPDDYRRLVERRIELIESDRFVGLVERPEHKRRWNWDAWDDLEADALRGWLLDRLEDARYWPEPRPRSAAQLADDARTDPDFVQVAQLYAGRVDVDLTDLVSTLVRDESVPYLAAWRYTPSGMRKREAWERTWDLQRREDNGEDVGTIPVPPKYAKADFATGAAWRLRGKLDVPKERFVAYPGAGRDTDPTPLVGWAGWDHLQATQALAALYEERCTRDGWDTGRLVPLLAGLAELVPWLRQWHNEPDPATGTRLGDFFADFVTTETHTHGLTAADLTAWRPPKPTRGRRPRRAD
jgi:hypothetical protein